MLEGDIEEFGTDALVRFIAHTRRSGCLELHRPSGMAEIRFSDGDICGASSSLDDRPLGLRLVNSGTVTRRRLRVALDEHVEHGARLGQVLVDAGDVDLALLSDVLREQMLDRILDILDWETGTFTWTPSQDVRLDEAVAITARGVFEERRRRNGQAAMVNRGTTGQSGAEGRKDDGHGSQSGRELKKRPSLSLAGQDADDIFDVIVVCTGNQFRSPIVEGLMRASTTRLPLRVTSVGTRNLGAAPALPEAVRLASEFGVDLTAHRAQSLRGFDLSDTDLVIGFELEHVAAAVVEANAKYERTFTILELLSLLGEADVPDERDPVRRARAAVDSAHKRRPVAGAPLPSNAQIQDPLGGRPTVYRATADQLRTATRLLVDRLFGFVPYSPPPPG